MIVSLVSEGSEKRVPLRLVLFDRSFADGIRRLGNPGGDQRGQLGIAERPAIAQAL